MDYSLQSYIKKLPTLFLMQELEHRISKGGTPENDFVIPIIQKELVDRQKEK